MKDIFMYKNHLSVQHFYSYVDYYVVTIIKEDIYMYVLTYRMQLIKNKHLYFLRGTHSKSVAAEELPSASANIFIGTQ